MARARFERGTPKSRAHARKVIEERANKYIGSPDSQHAGGRDPNKPTPIKQGPQARYQRAAGAAQNASAKANRTGKYLDHVAAANAHLKAAGVGKAHGVDVSHHEAAASTHQIAAHNVGPYSKMNAAMAHPKIDPVRAGDPRASGGTRDPRAIRERAIVSSEKARKFGQEASSSGDAAEHRKAANAHKEAATLHRRAGDSAQAGIHEQHAAAHEASVKAYQASGSKAVYNGSVSANRKAAALHQEALNKHAALGNHDAVAGHEAAGQEHSSIEEPVHTPDKHSNAAWNRTNQQFKEAFGNKSVGTGAGLIHNSGNAVTQKAFIASAKANAKPSLASHSLAAKAHEQAAASHKSGSGEQLAHQSQAEKHRIEARQHSLRIQKLKKIGPGQHHGPHGQFIGTPGGAK